MFFALIFGSPMPSTPLSQEAHKLPMERTLSALKSENCRSGLVSSSEALRSEFSSKISTSSGSMLGHGFNSDFGSSSAESLGGGQHALCRLSRPFECSFQPLSKHAASSLGLSAGMLVLPSCSAIHWSSDLTLEGLRQAPRASFQKAAHVSMAEALLDS